jgi:hypothetical protein
MQTARSKKAAAREHLHPAATSLNQILSLSFGKTLVLIGLVCLGGLFVRLHNLNGQSLECEELYTIPAATGHQYVYVSSDAGAEQNTFPNTSADYRRLLVSDSDKGLMDVNGVLRKNVHMPFYFYLMHYWIRLFGTSEWVLRLPSAVFGTVAIALIFLLGSEMFNPLVGFVCALLIAFMPEQIHYSQQARMYPLLALIAISSTYAITLARRHSSSRLAYILFAVLSVAGLYTHYEYFFLLAAQTVYIWVASTLGRRNKFSWLLTEAAIAAAFLPWLLIGLAQRQTSNEIIAWARGSLSAGMILAEILSKMTRLISVPEAPLGWLSVVVAYGLLISGLISLRSRRPTLLLLTLWIVLPLTGIVLMDYLLGTRAISIMRYWIIVAPAVYLLIAAGVDNLNHRGAQILLIAVLGGFLFSTALLTARAELRPKPDRHKEMAQFIDSQVANSNRETILSEGVNSIPLALAYYGNSDAHILRYKWVADQLGKQSVGELIGQDQNVWLLSSQPGRAAKLLEDNGYRLTGRQILYGHILLSHYERQETAKPD